MIQKRIFLSAGDDSGDMHASNLMREVRRQGGPVTFVGMGMRRMRAEGLVPLEEELRGGSAMWLHNVLRVAQFRRRLGACRKAFRTGDIDLVVLVDFGGFNLYLARAATAAGIPVLYYILPQVWAHGRYRLKKIRKWVTRALVIYPFEPPLYRRYGVEAEYVGHPLFDQIAQSPPSEELVRAVREEAGGRLVALFPGSRRQELRSIMPILLRSCARLQAALPEVRFAAVCPQAVRPVAEGLLARGSLEVRLLDVPPTVLARASDLCITKSGTITLEIASQMKPMVILYRVSPLFHSLAHGAAQTDYIGLVNNLAGRMVCPEKAMWRDDPDWVYEQALTLLADPARYEQCRSEIQAVVQPIARPGASRRAAEAVLELLGGA